MNHELREASVTSESRGKRFPIFYTTCWDCDFETELADADESTRWKEQTDHRFDVILAMLNSRLPRTEYPGKIPGGSADAEPLIPRAHPL